MVALAVPAGHVTDCVDEDDFAFIGAGLVAVTDEDARLHRRVVEQGCAQADDG